MAAMSSGKSERPSKIAKRGTQSTKKHRFQSFNQRIAKLKIDPVHRTQPLRQVECTTDSYFQWALARWKDLNLSEYFTNFVTEIAPLCDSLPQVLHHRNKILATLFSYIEKRDVNSLEPLFDLLANLAHDLGAQFEVFFPDALRLVTSISTKHPDVEVIEWSFECIAWLFKYLSRLLVPDLRPVFDIMAPLLGKEPQKVHTTRFAAEAFSFLLRRAALLYHKNPKPLDKIIGHMLRDLSSVDVTASAHDLYQRGLMTLFVESLKGVERSVHSSAPQIYQSLLVRLLSSQHDQQRGCEDLLCGITVGILNFTDAVGFSPILKIILDRIKALDQNSNNAEINSCGLLLHVVASVRKGSRIVDWALVLDSLLSLIGLWEASNGEGYNNIHSAAAVILSTAPLELVMPRLRPAINVLAYGRSSIDFLPLCNDLCSLNRDRFHDLVLPHFNKWILNHWREHELGIYSSFPDVIGTSQSMASCPAPLQQDMIIRFQGLRASNENVAYCDAFLEAMPFMSVSLATTNAINDILGSLIELKLAAPLNEDVGMLFCFGHGLKSFARTQVVAKRRSRIWPAIYKAANNFGTMQPYLEAVLSSLKYLDFLESNDGFEVLLDEMTNNLHSSSHNLRLLSLQILQCLHTRIFHCPSEAITTSLSIENNPLDLQSARSASLSARKLSVQLKALPESAWQVKAITHFCYGMLSFKLSQLCDDAIEVIKTICSTPYGEDVVSRLAFQWLEEIPDGEPSSIGTSPENHFKMTPFQCSNLFEIDEMIKKHATRLRNPTAAITEKFDASHQKISHLPAEAPSIALKIFKAIPQLAERRSRQLVPIFLQWTGGQQEEYVSDDIPESNAFQDASRPIFHTLGLQDRKVLLELFGLFVNPKVLYRASDVYDALLQLLASGDVTVQKSALKALFSWKSPSLLTYEEHLSNLLDDSRFRDELSTFVNVDQRDSNVQDHHRQLIMPVLIRILYGKIIARSGTIGRRGQSIKRKAVLQALARFGREELEDFSRVAVGPLANVALVNESGALSDAINREHLDIRKQTGLVTMVKDMLESLGERLAPLASLLMNALLYCSIRASRNLIHNQQKLTFGEQEKSQTSMLKDIRQIGLQFLCLCFRHFLDQDIEQFLPIIFDELINPRLEKLAIETSQSVSGLLHLFSIWASSPKSVTYLMMYNRSMLRSIVACLVIDSATDEVKLFVIHNILKKIIELMPIFPDPEGSKNVGKVEQGARAVLHPHMEYILQCLSYILHRNPGRELLESTIDLIALLAPHVEGSSETENLLEVSVFLLNQPSNRVKPKSKGDLLRLVEHFVPLVDLQKMLELWDRLFASISSLFGYFRDRANRQSLSRVLQVLAIQDGELRLVSVVCKDLNAFLTHKIDEPDFETRLKAFNVINESQYQSFSLRQWRPIVYNMLFYIRDTEELAIRSNASLTLKRFIEVTANHSRDTSDEASELTRLILLPALRNGALDPSELVRAEYISVMAHLIQWNPDWDDVHDMADLLCNDDKEASFFSNILHIQQHRRLRALRRLATKARSGGLRSTNVAHFFVPLVEHFIFDKVDDENTHNLSAESVITIGALAQSLEWPQFRAMFRRFTSYIQSKPNLEKAMIKLLGVSINALTDAAALRKALIQDNQANPTATPLVSVGNGHNTLSSTMASQEKLTGDLINNLLPSLMKYLHEKDESFVSLRVPLAISVVKLLKLLPPETFKAQIPAVLTDVCNILRSRAQDSRDMSRQTLVNIAALIGAHCFGFILKELRSSLAKGYQLHVLSFTVHSILVGTADVFRPGELDYCLPQIVAVVMDDIFGATGQEKDAEEYISKMKEVKSSKSYDSMELVAKCTSIESFVLLVKPIQDLLMERLDLKLVKKIDDLLRRIGMGLLRNEASNDRRTLIFCHELIRETYKVGNIEISGNEDPRTKRFLVNMKGANKYAIHGTTSSYRYKLARFSLDLLRSLLHRYEALQTPTNIQGFIPIIGDSLIQPNEEIQASAIRLLTTMIKLPLKDLDDNAGVYVSESVKIIKTSTNTGSELAQAALKLVSSILRERKRIEIREQDLAYLLKRLLPDLEEPDRQGAAFNFVRSVLDRKIIINEVYEVLDTVAAIMVTNHTRNTRDVARSAYFQFIQDFPQGKTRYSKQMTFLVKNLNYKHEEGRQSVMEVIHLFISKMGDHLVQDILGTFFVPLVMVMVNDESTGCREMAGTLVKMAFDRADDERMQSFLVLLRSWLSQSDQPLLVRVALQIYPMYLESAGSKGEKELSALLPSLSHIMKGPARDNDNCDWEILYFALQTFLKSCQAYPTTAFSTSWAPIWTSLRYCLAFHHAWVKLSAAKILSAFFTDIARTNAGNESPTLPLKGSGGIILTAEEMMEITRLSFRALRIMSSNEELASQSVRNLVFLGKHLGATILREGIEQSQTEVQEDEIESDYGEEDLETKVSKTAVQFIFERASAIIRRGPMTTKAPALTPMKAAVQLIGALCNHLAVPVLEKSTQTILLPLHNLTDPSIPTPFSSDEAFTLSYKGLVANSTEIMSLLQRRLGTTAYVAHLAKVREIVKGRREGRRVKRRIEAVAQPQKAGMTKRRRAEQKKARRKERKGDQRDKRRGW